MPDNLHFRYRLAVNTKNRRVEKRCIFGAARERLGWKSPRIRKTPRGVRIVKQRFIGLHSYLSWPNEAQRVLGNDQIATTLMAFKGNTISWFSGLFRSFSIASLFPFEVALNIGPELANRCVLERTGVFEPQDEQHIFEKFFWEECLPHR